MIQMQITQEELSRRLSSEVNLANSLPVLGVPSKGERPGEPRDLNHEQAVPLTPAKLSKGSKILAGSLARQGENVKEIASSLGLSTSQVNSAKNSKKPEIKGPIQSSLDRVSELAIDKLMTVLNLMTTDLFIGTNIKDLSIIGANMSRIIDKIRTPADVVAPMQLIIYAPEQRAERSYKVVDV
jgi:hypothetical protein